MLRRIAPSILLHHDDLVLIPVEIKKPFQAETFPERPEVIKEWRSTLISHSSPTADIQLYKLSVWFLNFSPSFTHALLSVPACHTQHTLIGIRVPVIAAQFHQFPCTRIGLILLTVRLCKNITKYRFHLETLQHLFLLFVPQHNICILPLGAWCCHQLL